MSLNKIIIQNNHAYIQCFFNSWNEWPNMVCKTVGQYNHKFFQNRKGSNLHRQRCLNSGDNLIKINYQLLMTTTFVLIDFSRNCLFIDLTIFDTSCFNNHRGLHCMSVLRQSIIAAFWVIVKPRLNYRKSWSDSHCGCSYILLLINR